MKKRTTEIGWTQHTWNPFVGCSPYSPGCANCYAAAFANNLTRIGVPAYQGTVEGFKWTGKINRASDDSMSKPLRIKRPSLVFVNSMSDFFHPAADGAWRAEAFDIMKKCPHLIFQILTKRAQNIEPMLKDLGIGKKRLPPNIWLGVTVENRDAVPRIDDLRRAPAHTRFLSCEPLLGPLGKIKLRGIHQVIVGGESGRHVRPCPADAVRDLRDKAACCGVPFFFKQWGHAASNPLFNSIEVGRSRVSAAEYVKMRDPIAKGGSLLDGRLWNEFPHSIPPEILEDLQDRAPSSASASQISLLP